MSRDEILRRFEHWLDTALAAEQPPSGIDAELLAAIAAGPEESNGTAKPGVEDQGCDTYALWAALTALTQEVKLQGRAFKNLSDVLDGQPSRIAEEMRAAYREREAEVRREAERKCRKDSLNALIDLRDRLWRGLESARKGESEIARSVQRKWLTRLFFQPLHRQTSGTVSALIRGYELGLERLDQALEESNAREIRCQGEMFDARRMNAVEREESSGVAAGTVLEVYRSGYEWNGEVFRTAQVKVAAGAPGIDNGNERSDRRH